MKISKKQLRFLIESFLLEKAAEYPRKSGVIGKENWLHPDIPDKAAAKMMMLKGMERYSNAANPDYFDGHHNQFGTQYDDYESESGRELRTLRRYPKVMWNEFADHDYFKNSIAKLHQIGYAHQSTQGDSIDKRYLNGSTELSVFGTESVSPLLPKTEEIRKIANSYGNNEPFIYNIYLALAGRVTWAGDFDAFTEELGNREGTEGQKSYKDRQVAYAATKSSGMPKRPGGVTLWEEDVAKNLNDMPIILDKEDVAAMKDGQIDEMIIDNWKISATILYIEANKAHHQKRFSIAKTPVKKIAENVMIWHERKKSTPFHRLMNARNDGFPNVKICDHTAKRYWTDSEVLELFSYFHEQQSNGTDVKVWE